MIGAQEILIIGGALVLIFGARKIPELARSLGKSMTEFKKGLAEPVEDQPEDKTSDKQQSASPRPSDSTKKTSEGGEGN